MPPRIVLATCRRWPELSESDRCLAHALERRGLRVTAAPWNGPFDAFAGADAVVIRATWDYHESLPAYRGWLDRLNPARTFNAPDLVRWNLEKSYLGDLAASGVPVPAFTVVEATSAAVAHALDHMDLYEAVIKPLWGANGIGVERVARGREAEALARVIAVTTSPRVLVQEFVPEMTGGEQSGVFLDGAFSHAFRRVPAPGEFRVNSGHGGRMEAMPGVDAEMLSAMSRIVERLPGEALYARIDGVMRDGCFTVMEVEVNEPSLGLHLAPGSAERLAHALAGRLA